MLQYEPAFRELKDRSHQIYFVDDFALRGGDQGLSIPQLLTISRCNDSRVKAALDNGLNDSKVRDRNCAFDDDSEIEILE
jgi:hypothetical protein